MKGLYLYLVMAASLLCSCELVKIEDMAPGEETISLKASGEVYKLDFSASGDWKATLDDDSWCKISPASGNSGDITMKISPSRNFTPEERKATLTISCLWNTRQIKLVQSAADIMDISPKEIKAAAEGGTYEIKIDHNVDITVTTTGEDDWYTVATKSAGTKALASDYLEVTVSPSRYGWPREGGFTVSSSVGMEQVRVIQEAAEVFSLSETSVSIPFSGGTFTVSLSGKEAYHIQSKPDWVVESGCEGRTHTFRASANESSLPRDGIIVFCDDGGVCLPLMLSQEARPGWTTSNFKHTSLVMRFTATWCGWCPRMNKSVKKAQENYPGKLYHLALHGNGSDLYFATGAALQTQYLIEGFPTGIVDGRTMISNGEINSTANRIVSASKETESLYGTVTGASVNSTVEDKTIDMDITVYAKATGEYKLTVLLVEDNINNAQADYEEGDHASYTHDGVARLAVTSIGGDSFYIPDAPATADFHFRTRINDKWKASNVKIVGYVQAQYGNRNKKRSGNYGDYYVDNCFVVEPGKTLSLATE